MRDMTVNSGDHERQENLHHADQHADPVIDELCGMLDQAQAE
jgi:hypothetical protein